MFDEHMFAFVRLRIGISYKVKKYLPAETQQAFLMQLTANESAVRFLSAHECEAYFSLSRKMLGEAEKR